MSSREDLNNQVKLHLATGLAQSTIQRVLAEDINTNLQCLSISANAFGISPESLLIPSGIPSAGKRSTLSKTEEKLLEGFRIIDELAKNNILGFIEVSRISKNNTDK